jgi:hypothetical protein
MILGNTVLSYIQEVHYMVNWVIFIYLFFVSIPGIVITVPGAVKSMKERILEAAPEGKKIPSMAVITVLGIVQSSILVLIASAAGTYFTPKVGLSAPFFQSLVEGEELWPSLAPQLLPAFSLGIGGALIFIAAYYFIARPRLDAETVSHMESLRMDLGIWGRILYGGIAEEVLTRWGLLSFISWCGMTLSGGIDGTIMWIAIIISGILFGLGHLPSYIGAGCKKTPGFIGFMILFNLYASLIFGWLFWQYGLVAAMIAHMLFHLVWYPFDLRVARKKPFDY